MRVFSLLSLLLVLSACWAEEQGEDYSLTETPITTPYLQRGDATLRVVEAEGFRCPDGPNALIYLVEPAQTADSRPGAVVLHRGAFDYVKPSGEYYSSEDRLRSDWAQEQIHRVLGLPSDDTIEDRGAWVGALALSGFRVAIPGNCWGDLWHGRGQGDLEADGFLRWGAYLAAEAADLLQAQPDHSGYLMGIGLAEGGRGLTELAAEGIPFDAVAIDSSPDYLPPRLDGASESDQYVQGLLRIYDYDLGEAEDFDAQLQRLQVALNRDSLAVQVNAQGYRTPMFYAYSSLDEQVPLDATLPLANALFNNYAAEQFVVLDWESTETAPSNRRLGTTTATLEFFDGLLDPPS